MTTDATQHPVASPWRAQGSARDPHGSIRVSPASNRLGPTVSVPRCPRPA